MRFDRLEIDAFGHFTNYSVPFDQGHSLHVLYGHNEAGKSTLLRSITQLLYGIPHNSKDSFLHPNSKLRIGGTISNSAGESITFYRRKGKTKTLLGENKEALPDNALVPFINVLSEDTFRSMFALNHETLREGGETLLDNNGHIGESLFAAASGINVIKQVMVGLDTDSKNLYKAGGSKPPINELIRKEKDLSKKVNESLMLARQWKELEKGYTDGQAEILEFREKYAQVSVQIKKLEKLRKASPKLAERKLLMEQISVYKAVPPLPNDCSLQRRELSKTIQSCLEVEQSAAAEEKKLRENLGSLSVDEDILKEESIIQSLNGDIGAYEKEKRDFETLKEQADVCRKQIDDLLANIGCDGASDMESLRIPSSRKERIRSLHEEHRILKNAISDLHQRMKVLEETVSQKKKEWDDFGELQSLDDLNMALSAVHDEGKLENRIAELQEELSDMNKAVDYELQLIPIWKGSRAEFADLQVAILDETIERFIEKDRSYKEDVLTWKQKIMTEEELLSDAHKALRNLEVNTIIPTEDHLAQARHERDESWRLVRKALEGKEIDDSDIAQFSGKENLADMYEGRLGKADQLADVMRRESAKVGMKQKYLNDIEEADTRIEGYKRKLELLYEEGSQLTAKWNALWLENGIIPLSPQEMKAWMAKYKEIKKMLAASQKKEELCMQLIQKRQQLKELLYKGYSSVKKLDLSIDDYSLGSLLKEAMTFKERESARILEKKSLEAEWKTKKMDLIEVEGELKEKERHFAVWKEDWEEAVSPIHLDASVSSETALEQVERYDRCIQLYDRWTELNAKMNASMTFVQGYEQKIASILERLDWSKPASIPSFVYKLAEELRQQQENKRDEKEWESQLENCVVEREKTAQKKKAAEESLNRLFSLAGVQTEEELMTVEEQFAAKQHLTRKINELDLVLHEIAGGGSIDDLEQEIEEQDMDLLEGRLAELQLELIEIDERRSEANQAFGVCKKEYEEKIQGNSISAVIATEEKESVVADLAGLCEQYVEKRLAVMILQKSIEYYRSQNQSPILTRASALFARLTQYSFEGLTVDYNDKDEEVIYGIRNGERIGIEAMSDGTKDQLYLALRVSSIEKYCQDNEPIPFIVDDILVHFDNKRSKVTLEILLELSRVTQVIFFTHHAHLVDLLRETIENEDYQFIEINKETALQA